MVFQPKECPKCASVYCHDCNQKYIEKHGKWCCGECRDNTPLTEMHRVVREVLEKLVFQCPKCASVKLSYAEIYKHSAACDGGEAAAERDAQALESFKQIE